MLFFYFFSSYLIASSITFYIDLYYPQARIRPESQDKVTEEYIKIFPDTIYNCLVAMPLFFHYDYFTRQQTNDRNFLENFVLWLIITDIIFYIVHRSLHHPKLYHLHSLHHSYKYTYGPSAIYASVPEFLIGNLGPSIISYQLLSLDSQEITIITVFQIFYTVLVSHGGYVEGHLDHHITRKEPYGLLLSDKIISLIKNGKRLVLLPSIEKSRKMVS